MLKFGRKNKLILEITLITIEGQDSEEKIKKLLNAEDNNPFKKL